jgi:streptogramin lyase
VWFADRVKNTIGKITPAGAVTQYTLPSECQPWEIVEGPDGNMWYTELLTDKIGKITPSGAVTEYALPEAEKERTPMGSPRGRTETHGSPSRGPTRSGRSRLRAS